MTLIIYILNIPIFPSSQKLKAISLQEEDVLRIASNGFNINVKDEFGSTALHLSSTCGRESVCKLLINLGININSVDKNNKTILHYVAEYNQVEIAELALRKGANISIEDRYGNQPLWTAVFNDKGRNARVKIVELFLQNAADPNHRNNAGRSPKDFVVSAGYKNLWSYFLL